MTRSAAWAWLASRRETIDGWSARSTSSGVGCGFAAGRLVPTRPRRRRHGAGRNGGRAAACRAPNQRWRGVMTQRQMTGSVVSEKHWRRQAVGPARIRCWGTDGYTQIRGWRLFPPPHDRGKRQNRAEQDERPSRGAAHPAADGPAVGRPRGRYPAWRRGPRHAVPHSTHPRRPSAGSWLTPRGDEWEGCGGFRCSKRKNGTRRKERRLRRGGPSGPLPTFASEPTCDWSMSHSASFDGSALCDEVCPDGSSRWMAHCARFVRTAANGLRNGADARPRK